jgi:sirohydrochlorin ferrochelatase
VLLAVAHGTRSTAGIDTVSQIADAVCTARPDLPVRLAWIELVPPDVRTALRSVPGSSTIVLVPLLLSSGYHDRVDLPAAVAEARPSALRAPVLGPDPLLSVALEARLVEAGLGSADAVVLAAAGSSDPDAVASVHAQAADLAVRLGKPVTAGFGSAAAPTVAEAVAAARPGTVAIAPYLLAPGFFADRLGEAGADGVAEPLGAHPAVVELVLERFASTLG